MVVTVKFQVNNVSCPGLYKYFEKGVLVTIQNFVEFKSKTYLAMNNDVDSLL